MQKSPFMKKIYTTMLNPSCITYIHVHSLLGKCLNCQLEPDYTELDTMRQTNGDEYMAIKIYMPR